MKKILINSPMFAIAMLMAGCMGNKVNPLDYKTEIKQKIQIPEICKDEYKVSLPKVAVVNFTNNSSFDDAEVSDTNFEGEATRNSATVVGVGVSNGGIVAGGASASKTKVNTSTTSTKRSVKSKLAEAVVPMVEGLVSNSGGAQIFSRADMDKIDAELKFQDSGLVDLNSAVEFGKLSGVNLLVTGSIDAVEQRYRNNSTAANGVQKTTSNSDNATVKIVGALLSIGASVTDGMIITPKVTIKIIDVQTGKILLTKQVEESVNIGKIKNPTYEQVIEGIKTAINDALPQIEEDFSKYFTVKGYITRLKADGDKLIAQVNIGREYGISENQIFETYVFEENENPLTQEKSCDRIKTDITLKATDRIEKETSWATVEGAKVGDIKLMQLVQKTNDKGGLSIPKF